MNILSVKDLDNRFYNLILEKDINVFLELGAFNAETSVKVKSIKSECEVIAFEANPYNYNMFSETLSHSGVDYRNLAISNYKGISDFFVQIASRGKIIPKTKKNNSLMERNDSTTYYEKVPVEVYRVDDIVDLTPSSNVGMWIDVEGVGYESLQGAKDTLRQTQLIKIEVESKQFWKSQITDSKIISFLESEGFKIDSRDQERSGQYNIIFTR